MKWFESIFFDICVKRQQCLLLKTFWSGVLYTVLNIRFVCFQWKLFLSSRLINLEKRIKMFTFYILLLDIIGELLFYTNYSFMKNISEVHYILSTVCSINKWNYSKIIWIDQLHWIHKNTRLMIFNRLLK